MADDFDWGSYDFGGSGFDPYGGTQTTFSFQQPTLGYNYTGDVVSPTPVDMGDYGLSQSSDQTATVSPGLSTAGSNVTGASSANLLSSLLKGGLGALGSILSQPKAATPSTSKPTIDSTARSAAYGAAQPYEQSLLSLLSNAGMDSTQLQTWLQGLTNLTGQQAGVNQAGSTLLGNITKPPGLSQYSKDAASLAYKAAGAQPQDIEDIKRQMRTYYGHGEDVELTNEAINKYVLASQKQAADILSTIGGQQQDLRVKYAALAPSLSTAYQGLVGPAAQTATTTYAGMPKEQQMTDVQKLNALVSIAQLFGNMSNLGQTSTGATGPIGQQQYGNQLFSMLAPTLLNALFPNQTAAPGTTSPATTPAASGTADQGVIQSILNSIFA